MHVYIVTIDLPHGKWSQGKVSAESVAMAYQVAAFHYDLADAIALHIVKESAH